VSPPKLGVHPGADLVGEDLGDAVMFMNLSSHVWK
jgi:hypothetical protein